MTLMRHLININIQLNEQMHILLNVYNCNYYTLINTCKVKVVFCSKMNQENEWSENNDNHKEILGKYLVQRFV